MARLPYLKRFWLRESRRDRSLVKRTKYKKIIAWTKESFKSSWVEIKDECEEL